MKSMSKQQLADCAGVSRRTLMRWCQKHWEELEQLGMGPNDKVLSPKICKYIIKNYGIDV